MGVEEDKVIVQVQFNNDLVEWAEVGVAVLSQTEWDLRQANETQQRLKAEAQVLLSLCNHLESDSWRSSASRDAVNKLKPHSLGRTLLDLWADDTSETFTRLWSLSLSNHSVINLLTLVVAEVGSRSHWSSQSLLRAAAADRTAFAAMASDRLSQEDCASLTGSVQGHHRKFALLMVANAYPEAFDTLGRRLDNSDLINQPLDLETGESALILATRAIIVALSDDSETVKRGILPAFRMQGLIMAHCNASELSCLASEWLTWHIASLRWLCGLKGADLSVSDASRVTLLHLACDSKSEDTCAAVVSVLLDANSNAQSQAKQFNVDQKTRAGDAALHLACAKNHLKVVNLLLDNGADPSIKDKRGNKPNVRSGNNKQKKTMRLILLKAQSNFDKQQRAAKLNVQASKSDDSSAQAEAAPAPVHLPVKKVAEVKASASTVGEEVPETARAVAKTGAARMLHIQSLVKNLVVTDEASVDERTATNLVDEIRDGIVPEHIELDGNEPEPDGDVDDGGNSDYDDDDALSANWKWEESLFEFEITREASNQLSRLNQKDADHAMNRMRQVGDGIQSPRLWHPLTENVPSELELFSTSFGRGGGFRVLWELSPAYSSSTKTYREVIKIWYVGKHTGYEKKIPMVVKCFREGLTCIPERRKRLKRHPNKTAVQSTPGSVRYPTQYTLMDSEVEAKETPAKEQTTELTSACAPELLVDGKPESSTACPPAEVVDDSRTLVKFYQMNAAFCSLVLKGVLSEKLQFPFKTDQLEDDIINQTGTTALLLVGRSGTGKTTISMNRMFIAWQRFYVSTNRPSAFDVSHDTKAMVGTWNGVFVTANPVLVTAVRDVFRNMQLGYASDSCIQILPEKPEQPSTLHAHDCSLGTFPMFVSAGDWLALLDATMCSTELPSLREECERAEQAHRQALEDQDKCRTDREEEIRSFKVSEEELQYSAMLPSERSFELEKCRHRLNLCKSKEQSAAHREIKCRADVEASKLKLGLAAKPFIEDRVANATQSGMLSEQGSLTDLLRQNDIIEIDGTDEQSDGSRQEVDSRKFDELFWASCSSRLTKGYTASTVWTEIVSYIEGSVQSLRTESCYLSRQEYSDLGRKIGSFGNPETRSTGTDREGVYSIFEQYRVWKQNRDWYDRMDVIHDVYQRVLKLGYRGVPIHSMSVDEVQDFTQAELCLYLKVIANPNDILLAGDTCQTIARGVGFRFEDIRLMFHELNQEHSQIKVPPVTTLSVNYRTHNGILGAAAEVVSMIQNMFPDSIDNLDKDKGYFPGSPPFIVTEREDLLMLLMGGDEEKSQVCIPCPQLQFVRCLY